MGRQALGVETEDDVQLLVNYFVAVAESEESLSSSRKMSLPHDANSEHVRSVPDANSQHPHEVCVCVCFTLRFTIASLLKNTQKKHTKKNK